MSNLSNTRGEGGSGGRQGDRFIDTGYGTHDGQGNVPTGTDRMEGTGFDEHGQVKTSFGKFAVAYDPVTGMATENVTAGYSFPAGSEDALLPGGAGGGGLVDVSARASDHATHAAPQMQRAVQEFFEARAAQQQPPQPPEGPEAAADEGSGQGAAERTDAGAYLGGPATRAGAEAEAWRGTRPSGGDAA